MHDLRTECKATIDSLAKEVGGNFRTKLSFFFLYVITLQADIPFYKTPCTRLGSAVELPIGTTGKFPHRVIHVTGTFGWCRKSDHQLFVCYATQDPAAVRALCHG
jgi:hypothetical protein